MKPQFARLTNPHRAEKCVEREPDGPAIILLIYW